MAAASPVGEHRLPLSNLDLLLPALDVGVFFCYKKPRGKNYPSLASMVCSLKASLAETLEMYYPFAGEVVANSAGEPELLCNNRGVDFVVAQADVELRALRLCHPSESVEGKLVPPKKGGVLCVQVHAWPISSTGAGNGGLYCRTDGVVYLPIMPILCN